MIKPEQMSLAAHSHIQKILTNGTLTEENVNSVQRLSQHLRVLDYYQPRDTSIKAINRKVK